MFKSEIAFLVTFSLLILSLMVIGLVHTQRATSNLQAQVDQWAHSQHKLKAIHEAKMSAQEAVWRAQDADEAAYRAKREGAREAHWADNKAKGIAERIARRK